MSSPKLQALESLLFARWELALLTGARLRRLSRAAMSSNIIVFIVHGLTFAKGVALDIFTYMYTLVI